MVPNGIYFILDDQHNIVPTSDTMEWGQFFEDISKRRVDVTYVQGFFGELFISTVCLGLDHNWGFEEETRPIVFETMIFGGPWPEYQERYCTWGEAVEGHKRAVLAAKIARFNLWGCFRENVLPSLQRDWQEYLAFMKGAVREITV